MLYPFPDLFVNSFGNGASCLKCYIHFQIFSSVLLATLLPVSWCWTACLLLAISNEGLLISGVAEWVLSPDLIDRSQQVKDSPFCWIHFVVCCCKLNVTELYFVWSCYSHVMQLKSAGNLNLHYVCSVNIMSVVHWDSKREYTLYQMDTILISYVLVWYSLHLPL